MKNIFIALLIGVIVLTSFDKKQAPYEVVEVTTNLESQYGVTLWIKENKPSKVVQIVTTGYLWYVFYVK